jgi:hypothetical protein
LHCGFVRCEDEAMKLEDEVPQQMKQGRTIRFTTTITISKFIVNSCTSSSNLCTLPLQQVTTPVIKVPRYGGKVVGYDALDAEDQHVRALMLAFQQHNYGDAEELSLSDEAMADALFIANTLWVRGYRCNDNNQPHDHELIDEFDSEDAEVEDEVVLEPAAAAVANALDIDDAATLESLVIATVTVFENESVDDGMGSVWVVPADSGVQVRRSGQVVAASDSLGTCWIRLHGRTLRRFRRLR